MLPQYVVPWNCLLRCQNCCWMCVCPVAALPWFTIAHCACACVLAPSCAGAGAGTCACVCLCFTFLWFAMLAYSHGVSSYAVTCMFFLRELRNRGVHITFRDTPLYQPHWQHRTGLLPAQDEAWLRNLPPPQRDPDAVVRFHFPLNLTSARSRDGSGRVLPTFVYGTTEMQVVTPSWIGASPLTRTHGEVCEWCWRVGLGVLCPALFERVVGLGVVHFFFVVCSNAFLPCCHGGCGVAAHPAPTHAAFRSFCS